MSNTADTILPDSISMQNDIAAFDVAVKKYLDTVPLSKLLVYNIDEVDSRALTLLAKQFDVLGYKGIGIAHNEAEKRGIIKRAIELHRYKGTPWAVKEAMKSVGFADATITEHVAGPAPIWANFSVTLLNEGVGISVASVAALRKMIEEYKPQRSNLIELNMDILIIDILDLNDDEADLVEDISSDDNLALSNKLFYDGAANYNGSYDHSGDSDVVIWTQL